MNKKTIMIIAAIAVLIAGAVGYLAVSGDGKQAKQEMVDKTSTAVDTVAKDETPEITPETSETPETTPPKDTASAPGVYTDYKSTSIADTAGTKLLFFHAPWCPQCRDLEADIKRDGVPSGVTIIKVDYDSNQALRQKYGVTIQTTIVRVDDSGALVKKYVAYEEPTLDSVKENLL